VTDLTPREEALVLPIVAEVAKEPGLPVRDLGVLIGKNMGMTLRVVQKLVDSGVVERRQIRRSQSAGFERNYSGLFLASKSDGA